MKFITLFSCLLLAAFIGHTLAEEDSKPDELNRYNRHRRSHRRPKRNPCGSNDLGDYKGGCDVSVPVLVMPKGRPIMERVLDWFKCENCGHSQPIKPIIVSPTTTPIPTTGDVPTVTGTITTPGTSTGGMGTGTSAGTGTGTRW